MPTLGTAPSQPQLFAAPNGNLSIRVPTGNGSYKRVELKTSQIPVGRKKFAAYLKKAGLTGIDAATDPINTSWGLLDPTNTRSAGYQIKQLRGQRPGANGANGAAPVDPAVLKRREASKASYYRRKGNEAVNGSVAKGDKLAEARDLVQIIAGAWAAASTALRRLETLLGSD